MGRSYVCPFCAASGPSTIAKGYRKTKTIGLRRVRYCKACQRKFTPKHQPEISIEPAADQSADVRNGDVRLPGMVEMPAVDAEKEPWTSS